MKGLDQSHRVVREGAGIPTQEFRVQGLARGWLANLNSTDKHSAKLVFASDSKKCVGGENQTYAITASPFAASGDFSFMFNAWKTLNELRSFHTRPSFFLRQEECLLTLLFPLIPY